MAANRFVAQTPRSPLLDLMGLGLQLYGIEEQAKARKMQQPYWKQRTAYLGEQTAQLGAKRKAYEGAWGQRPTAQLPGTQTQQEIGGISPVSRGFGPTRPFPPTERGPAISPTGFTPMQRATAGYAGLELPEETIPFTIGGRVFNVPQSQVPEMIRLEREGKAAPGSVIPQTPLTAQGIAQRRARLVEIDKENKTNLSKYTKFAFDYLDQNVGARKYDVYLGLRVLLEQNQRMVKEGLQQDMNKAVQRGDTRAQERIGDLMDRLANGTLLDGLMSSCAAKWRMEQPQAKPTQPYAAAAGLGIYSKETGEIKTPVTPKGMTPEDKRKAINNALGQQRQVLGAKRTLQVESPMDQLTAALIQLENPNAMPGQPLTDEYLEIANRRYDAQLMELDRQLDALGYKRPSRTEVEEWRIGETGRQTPAASYISKHRGR